MHFNCQETNSKRSISFSNFLTICLPNLHEASYEALYKESLVTATEEEKELIRSRLIMTAGLTGFILFVYTSESKVQIYSSEI